jgi:hypothetical protein
LETIRNDLHGNAVRLQGLNLDRLAVAAQDALRRGLAVWLFLEMWDRPPEETRAHVAKGTPRAEELRARWPWHVVFSVGSEVIFFTQGVLPGDNVLERLAHPSLRETLKAGQHNPPLDAFLAAPTAQVREVFRGPVTYASVGLETVDRAPFDFVGVDLYREKCSRDMYPQLIERYLGFGKPVANMEFGCCTFKGAEDLGGRGWDLVDWSKMPPEIKGDDVYDQTTQAHEVAVLLQINDEAGVDSAFVLTFEAQAGLEDANREEMRQLPFDLDIARYGLVKMHVEEQRGTVYPDMPCEPKVAVRAVADYYAFL